MIYLFVVFTIGFIVIIEVFTVLFQLTGISKSKARFQVISILTGTGFTTKESEIITSSKIRRNIAQLIMIFGYTSSATIVTILFSVVRSADKISWFDLLFVILSFAIIFFIVSQSKFRKKADKIIENLATRALFGKNTNTIVIKDSYDNDMVLAEIVIKVMPEIFKGKKLQDTTMSKLGISVLVVERIGTVVANVTRDTILLKDDTVTVFGPQDIIDEVFYKSIKESFKTEQNF